MMITKTLDNSVESINVLLVGNNPGEVSNIYDHIGSFKPLFVIAVAFNLRRIFRRIRKFKPASILIDDRLNRKKLRRLIQRLHRNPNTSEIPVTLLKSTNDEFGIRTGIDEYILKEGLTAEQLRNTIINSRRLRRTSIYLYKSYKMSRNIFEKFWLELRYRF